MVNLIIFVGFILIFFIIFIRKEKWENVEWYLPILGAFLFFGIYEAIFWLLKLIF